MLGIGPCLQFRQECHMKTHVNEENDAVANIKRYLEFVCRYRCL